MQKQNRVLVQELQFIKTTDLLVRLVSCIRWISILSTIRTGSMALVAILLANFFKDVYDGEQFDLSMFLSMMFAIYAIAFTLLTDYVFLSKSKARKEVINHILAMRNARANASPRNNSSNLENTSNEN
jgi:hypothetical protein